VSARRRALVTVVLVTVGGQAAALAYEIAVARRFGTGGDADTLALALTVAVAMANELVTWIGTLFIPLYVVAVHASAASAARMLRRTLLAVLGLTGGLAAVLAAGATPLLALLAPGLVDRPGAVALLRLFLPLLLLLPLAAVLAGVLQARGRFGLAGLRALCWYAGALLALLLGPGWGVHAVPVGMTAGLAVFCAVLARGAAAGPPAPPDAADPAPAPRLSILLAPLVLASAANSVNVGVERALAARLPEGNLAALTYAFRLVQFPVTLVLLNATTILLPALATHAARQELRSLETMLGRALRLALLGAIPLAALTIPLGEPLVRLLFERDAFTPESTRLTSTALVWYAPSLVGVAGVQVLARGYQALQAIPRMAALGIAAVALNLALMPTLTALLGLRGLPLATSTTTVALLAAMLLGLRRQLPGLPARGIVESALGATAAALAALAVAWLAGQALAAAPLAHLAVGSALGLAVYAGTLRWLSPADARLALDFVTPAGWRRD
jgi:putative peptidoglycan lipid II flippase